MKYLVYAVFFIAALSKALFADAPPNVILMMADDLANEDLSSYGSKRIETPNIDQLAEEGLKLKSFYAGNPVCTPSRMALLSGSYPARLGWRWGVLGYGFQDKSGMSPRVYTMAEAFRDAGYYTAISGKWHIGDENMAPELQGFQSAYYIRMSNNQNRDIYRDGELVHQDWDNRLLTETFTEEVIRVIEEERDEPFFLYVPWTAPHFPADPHPDWQSNSGEDKSGKYTDVVEELDYRVGEIMKALQATGKADNTIVIFTSDNGRQKGQQGPNEELRFSGQKWQSLEGGTRVPFILRYPKVIKAGKTNNDIISAIDLFPTLAEACDVEIQLPSDAQKMDGVSAWKHLKSFRFGQARTELLYWHGRGMATAIRLGNWKLHFNYGAQNPSADPPLKNGPALYNLKRDPLEKNNLAANHPGKVEKLKVRAKELLTDIYEDQL
ncbi:MAG: sulfatase-like hydrolase/transferase, partial [Opitutales bacterium]